MGPGNLSTAHVQVDFKIKPILIPSVDIKRLAKFPQSGGLGDVWKCSLSTSSGTRLVALKSIRVRNLHDSEVLHQAGWRIRREAYVWLQLSHDHIVPFEGIIVDHDFGPLPALVSLWMPNGTLNEYLKREFPRLSDRRKLELIQQVAAGLSYLHGKDIAHGDLTPNNILVDGSQNLRLTDFGLSMVVPESGNVTFGSVQAGHTRWMAPEFVAYANDSEEPQSPPKPTEAGDIYSFGCVMLQIFSGKEPYFQIQNMMQLNNAIGSGQEPFRGVEINMDETYRLLSSWCLSREPEERPSILGVTTIVDPIKVLAVASRPLPAQIFGTFKNISPSRDPRSVCEKNIEGRFPRSAVSLIPALKTLGKGARTKDPELASAIKAILPILTNMQSSGETDIHSAARKVLQAAAHNVQLVDVVTTIPPIRLPQVHPLLAYHPYIFPINYDVSRIPDTASANVQASPIPLSSHRHTAATNPPTSALSLKSDLLPWRCEIRTSTYRYITVEDVLYQLYRFLHTAGTYEEYKAIPSQRYQVVESYKRRCLRAEGQNEVLKRVDFLVGCTTFMGLSSTKLGPDVLALNLQ